MFFLFFYVHLIIVYKNCPWGILIFFEYFCKMKWISMIISINYTVLLITNGYYGY